jgi:DNA-binding transcriptional regulator GbsR (MarR family)
MDLSKAEQTFVLHWGDMSTRWGINRSVAQIHALLYIAREPMNAEEISKTLSLARSNVSTSLRELQSWRIIRVANKLGDRRDHYESLTDPWDLFLTIMEERKRREIDPTLAILDDCIKEASQGGKDQQHVRERLENLRDFIATLSSWYNDTSSLSRAGLIRFIKMGKKVFSLLGISG